MTDTLVSKPSDATIYDCAVIGNWHLAFVTAASLSSLGLRTLLVSPQILGHTTLPEPPVHEPGLGELMAKSHAAGLLDYAEGITANWNSKVAWLAIDTPVNENDEADVTSLIEAASQLRELRSPGSLLIVGSQIPLGFSRALQNKLGLTVAHIPENLRLGQGLNTFLNADRTVIGADHETTRETVKTMLGKLTTEFLLCDLNTAEMIKHATNAFLATSISFANELARIGEKYGVDNLGVGRALKLDKRIGKAAYVAPGLGFAGGTLPRDLRVLQQMAALSHTPSPLVNSVLEINENTTAALTDSLRSYLGGLKGKRILIVGYTYKAETDTLRRSLSVDLARLCAGEGALVEGFDPPLNGRDLSAFGGKITHHDRWEGIENAPDALVIMTPRPQFKELKWETLPSPKSETPSFVLDARGVLDPKQVLASGFAYKALWQPVQLPGKDSHGA
jgi:UDPglucose 6-dehydrogenase